MSSTTQPREELTREQWNLVADVPSPPLLALWADTREVYALLHVSSGAARLVSTSVEEGGYPALSPTRPAAAWFERMVHDLWGHTATGGTDQRPWLDHGRWAYSAPLALRPGPPTRVEPPEFAASDDVDQVPLGPVRGGIAPAAHLRFGVHGETIVRLEARLGYGHKGTLSLMRGKSPRAAARFAARLAGEATVAHAIAFARASEAALVCEVPPRASTLRLVMADIECISCHLDALATVAEAAEFAMLSTWCARHGEALRRAANVAFGHRLMMDCVIPGGVAADIVPGGAEGIGRVLSALAAELPDIARMPLAGRLSGVGVVTTVLAAQTTGAGLLGRAGDAEARARARFEETVETVRQVRNRLAAMPEGAVSVPLPVASGEGLGNAQGPAGEVWHWLRLDHGQIASVFMRDPTWAHWPLLEQVMAGSQADDLPLVLASFGLSSSGADL